MRNKTIAIFAILATIATPVSAIAEPIAKTKIDEVKVVEAIEANSKPYTLPTKEEIAKKQIEENLKKIEEERKAAEAILAAQKAAEAAKAAAQVKRTVVVKQTAPVNLQALYAAASARFGVHPAILAAVHYVETGQRGNTTVSSYAGAQGPMQFMPSTFRAYAVDGDGDGVANIHDVDDAVFSAARYLAANGAASGNVNGALYRYNHSMAYVNKVLGIARGYGYNG